MLKNKFLLVFLFVFLVFLPVYSQEQPVQAPQKGQIKADAAQEFVYDSKGKRNPFIPLVTSDGKLLKLETEESSEGLLLEGIIHDKKGISYAIVNGDVVRAGDNVGDYQVLRIEDNKVVFVKDGEPIEVELKKEEE